VGTRRELLYKVLVVGDIGTGKTSIIKRYVHAIFTQHYKSTIGVDFALKVLQWDTNTTVRLQLWDIAGQERFGNMTRVYYKEAVGAFVVFDVTRTSTFEAVKKWKADIDAKVMIPGTTDQPIPVVLLANKIDLVNAAEGWGKSKAEMEQFCQDHGFVGWFETSAKDDVQIDTAANKLVATILEKVTVTSEESDPDAVKLEEQPKKQDDDCPC
jgi:Ras-related protein Rab-32